MFVKYLKMDFYKMIRSKNFALHVLTPLILIGGFLIYFKIYSNNKIFSNDINKLLVYVEVVAIGFPLIISIVMQFMYEQEEEGGFIYFLGCPGNRYIPYISKLVIIFLFEIIALSITFLGFSIFFSKGIGLEIYFKLIIIIFFSSIILYILQFLVVMAWGKGANLGIGVVGCLICALMQTGLGDRIWIFVPWAYGLRISEYFILGENRGLFPKGLYVCGIIYLVILIIVEYVFIKKWEGRKFDD